MKDRFQAKIELLQGAKRSWSLEAQTDLDNKIVIIELKPCNNKTNVTFLPSKNDIFESGQHRWATDFTLQPCNKQQWRCYQNDVPMCIISIKNSLTELLHKIPEKT